MTKEVTEDVLVEAMLRYRIGFQSAAGRAGGVIRWLGQHTYIWSLKTVKGGGSFKNEYWVGVCAGLAMEWMKAKRKKEDLVGKFLGARKEAFTKEGDKPASQAFTAQISFAHAQQGEKTEFLQNEFRETGEKKFDYPYSNFGAALKKKRFYYVSSATKGQAGGHATAIYVNSKGKVDFYDPNIAEITGTSPSFFDTYLQDVIDGTAAAIDHSNKADFTSKKKWTATEYQAL